MNYSFQIFKMIFYLALVLALIYLIARFMKKFYLQPNGGENMQLIEQLYLDSKKSLKLVQVKDEILLFSVSEDEITLLKEWPEAEFENLIKQNTEQQKDFSSSFKKIFNKYRRGSDE
mgnify:CR=1 FL=1